MDQYIKAIDEDKHQVRHFLGICHDPNTHVDTILPNGQKVGEWLLYHERCMFRRKQQSMLQKKQQKEKANKQSDNTNQDHEFEHDVH